MSRFNYSRTSFDKDELDISDADQNDIAKILKDTDDIDGDLFKGISKSSSTNLSKTMPTQSTKPSMSAFTKNKNFTFDDDPLDEIENIIGSKKYTTPTTASKPPLNKQTSSSEDRKPPVPPSSSQLSSTMPISTAKTTIKSKSNLFDDADDFGFLESSDKSKSKVPSVTQQKSNNNEYAPSGSGKSRSLADELFGKSSTLATNNENDTNEFKLSDKYLNMSQSSSTKAANNDDEVGFGSYVPSAISNTPRNTIRRNVSFTDDLFGSDTLNMTNRPKTTSSIGPNRSEQKDDTNFMQRSFSNPPTKGSSNEDWLSSSHSNDTHKQNSNNINGKPKSNEFNLDDLIKPKEPPPLLKQQTSGTVNNKDNFNIDLDWLTMKETSRTSSDKDFELFDNKNKSKSLAQTLPNNFNDKPPIPVNNSKALNGLIEPLTKALNTNKDSMNSSFADSIENMEKPNTQAPTTSALSALIQPIDFKEPTMLNNNSNNNKAQIKENEFGSNVPPPPSESEDGWLNALISKKSGKKTNKSETLAKTNDLINQIDNSNLVSDSNNNSNGTGTGTIRNNNNSNTNDNNNNNNQKSSYYLHDRSSTPVNDQLTIKQQMDSKKLNYPSKFISDFKPISGVNYDSNEIQAMIQKIKQLEYENQDLHMQIQHNKAHYELQMQLVQDSCENRIKMIKEDRENSLRHFKEEKDLLQKHIELIEKEKQEMSSIYKRKSEDIQNECDMEIEKLRKIQREAIDTLKLEHENVLKRVKQMKDTELDAAMAATAHTRTIESVLNLIEDNTKNLDGLNQKVQMNHMMNLNEHEIKIRTKEEQLKVQEERLMRRQKEYENEIRQLNETIQRLENHLAEQSKQVAEERWKGKQQEKKLEALQEALMNEQRIVMDKLARERNEIDRSKDDILVEQKRLMQQIYEEKRKIAEDRAQLEASLNAYKDKQHKDSLSNINVEAEITVNTRRMNDEKIRLDQLGKELKDKELQLKEEKLQLEEKKRELEIKVAKLEQMAIVVNQKYSQAEDLFSKSNKEKESNMKILEQVNNIKLNHDSRLNQLQQQLMVINEREAQLNQEKVSIYKQRQELEILKSSIMCTKCKEPVKDFNGLNGLATATTGYASLIQTNLSGFSPGTMRYQSPLYQINNYDLEDAKTLRQFKIQALKDRQFLNEEKEFINTLRSNTLNKSFSLNQLNSSIVT